MFCLGNWHVTEMHDCGLQSSTHWNGSTNFITAFIIKHWTFLMVHSPWSLSDAHGMPRRSPPPIFHFCTPFRLIKLPFFSPSLSPAVSLISPFSSISSDEIRVPLPCASIPFSVRLNGFSVMLILCVCILRVAACLSGINLNDLFLNQLFRFFGLLLRLLITFWIIWNSLSSSLKILVKPCLALIAHSIWISVKRRANYTWFTGFEKRIIWGLLK